MHPFIAKKIKSWFSFQTRITHPNTAIYVYTMIVTHINEEKPVLIQCLPVMKDQQLFKTVSFSTKFEFQKEY